MFIVDSRVFQWNPLQFWAMGTTTAELAEWGQNRDTYKNRDLFYSTTTLKSVGLQSLFHI